MTTATWQQQAFRFIVVGVVATLSDAGTYTALLSLGTAVSIAKALAFIIGTTVSYVLNKRWTFEHTGTDPVVVRRFLALYGVTLVFNVAVNAIVIEVLSPTALNGTAIKTLAYLLATATSTILNFIGSRLWVFRHGGP